ncbi:MAG: hypothetical protein ACI8TP_000084 [Acidimicrobiales bacterium]|jgi:hypothetical protein
MADPLYDDHEEQEGNVVRPFMLTKGRTRSSTNVDVRMESLIDRRVVDAPVVARLDSIQRKIWDALDERSSAAEVSAYLQLPLGVVCVLVGDMAGSELLEVHQTASTTDVELVRRLIDGVRAL